jgi:hypothetical protein
MPPRYLVGGGHLRLPNVAVRFKRTQERPSVKKLLVFEKEINDGLPRRPRQVSR